ncbi:MAG: hypothetical protein U0172_05985 [Nitrospiraceae bacterium]
MADRVKETDPEKLPLLYERFRDVCFVEKEVWLEIFMPRDVKQGGLVLTQAQQRYEVEIDDPKVEATIDANIPMGKAALGAAIQEYRVHITFYRKG